MKYNKFANNICNAGERIVSDEACKKVLANKQILAWILEACVDECKGMTREKIAKAIIGKPEVLNIPVHQDELLEIDRDGEDAGNTEEDFITNEDAEDASVNEGIIRYDIRFTLCLSNRQYPIKLIINVEAQGRSSLSYAVETRGIYYCCRMISSQYGKELKKSHYENIKKVYSIWICLNPRKADRDSIVEYDIRRNVTLGNPATERKENYDKMKVAVINLGGTQKDGVIGMLNTLFDEEEESKEKLRELHENYEIEVSEGLKQEVDDMCNVNYYFLEKGIERGMERGLRQGAFLQTVAAVCNLMRKKNFTKEEAMEVMDVTQEDWEEISGLVDQKLEEELAIH